MAARSYFEIRSKPFWFGGERYVVGGATYYAKSKNISREFIEESVKILHRGRSVDSRGKLVDVNLEGGTR